MSKIKEMLAAMDIKRKAAGVTKAPQDVPKTPDLKVLSLLLKGKKKQ